MTTITIERAVVHRALSALEYHTQQTRPIHNTELVIEELRDALSGNAPATAPDELDDCTPNHSCGGRTVHLPLVEQCDKCGKDETMTTITIERALLEKALVALSAPNHCVFSEPQICVDLRAALAAPESGAMAEIDYTDDDALRFIQRVLESDAPLSDIRDARNMVVGIRTRVLKARAAKPATAPDRHAQELLAQDITIANMRERHAQELCAYQITVDKLKAERKPMGTAERVRAFQAEPDPVSYEDFIRGIDAAEAHHGIGDKT